MEPLEAALDAYFDAHRMIEWKHEGGPVFWTAKAAASRAEEHFFRLLLEQRATTVNTKPALVAG